MNQAKTVREPLDVEYRFRRRDGQMIWVRDRASIGQQDEGGAVLVDGLIALYEATGESRWLEEAAAIADVQIELFADSSGGGFYYTASDQSQLLVRGKQPHDGPLPSSAAISARNLKVLARELNRSDFAELAESTLKSLAPRLAEVPAAMPRTAVLVEERLASEQKN